MTKIEREEWKKQFDLVAYRKAIFEFIEKEDAKGIENLNEQIVQDYINQVVTEEQLEEYEEEGDSYSVVEYGDSVGLTRYMMYEVVPVDFVSPAIIHLFDDARGTDFYMESSFC